MSHANPRSVPRADEGRGARAPRQRRLNMNPGVRLRNELKRKSLAAGEWCQRLAGNGLLHADLYLCSSSDIAACAPAPPQTRATACTRCSPECGAARAPARSPSGGG
jgi:hypothetical protein